MITVPAMRLHQFGVYFYQAILGVRDVQKLVRFEVLSYSDDRAHARQAAGEDGTRRQDQLGRARAARSPTAPRPTSGR